MKFLELLHKPEHVWTLEEINRYLTGPTGDNYGLDHIDPAKIHCYTTLWMSIP